MAEKNKRDIPHIFSENMSVHMDINSIDFESLRKEQRLLAKKVILEDTYGTPEIVAGIDLSYKNATCIVAYVALKSKTLGVLEKRAIKHKVVFPYIPTFLAYREGPPILALLEQLEIFPDILLINGHGIAHPLFCGCASHIGVLTNIPTIGVAKRLLHGMASEIPVNVGSHCDVKYRDQRVAAVFLSKKGCKPIIISAGHLITLDSAIQRVKQSLKGYKFPEPLRLAHKLAQEAKERI